MQSKLQKGSGVISMNSAAYVKDPVCGMAIETVTAGGQSEYNGQTYYFCGSICKETFDLNPEQYLDKSAGTPKTGHGCKCCLFNYLYPRHMDSSSGCSVSHGLRHFTHLFGRSMEIKGEKTFDNGNAASVPQSNRGDLHD